MTMYNLIEHSSAYSMTPEILWQYYRHEPAIEDDGNIIYFPSDNSNSNSFKFKQEITGKRGNSGTKHLK